MATIVEIEKLALSLPEKERAGLAAHLLDSMPGDLFDEDEGVAEALHLDAEIDANRDETIALAQLDAQIQSRRRDAPGIPHAGCFGHLAHHGLLRECGRAILFQKAADSPESYRVRERDLRRVNLNRFPYHFSFV